MSATANAAYSSADLGAEVQGLRRDTLKILIFFPPVVGWIWFYTAVVRGLPTNIQFAPLLVLLLVYLGASKLIKRRYDWACWLFLLGMLAVDFFLVTQSPSLATMAFGMLIILLACALVPTQGAVIVTALAMAAAILAKHYHAADGAVAELVAQANVLYLLTLAVSWLVTRPLRTATTIALASWEQTRRALLELRERRGELYGTVRSLEEALRRIEHTNNELLVARREAEAARALKARFASTVSHEMRSPLNLILGFSKLMALSPESYGEPLPQPYRADAYCVYRNCEHLVSLVDDILDLSQIEAQRLPLLKSLMNINSDVINDAVAAMGALIKRKGLDLQLELADDLPPLLADPARIRQVVLNLLANAVRFTKGTITLRTCRQGERILVSVKDSGPGIPSSDMPKLFREFHQLSVTETRYEGGSGLGLAICKYLVELHSGEIWAQSVVGQGTTFTFSLPLTHDEALPGGLVATDDVRRAGNPHPICLIVHDDPGIMRLLVRHLEGYHMVGTAPGEGIGALVEDLRPAAILTSPELRPVLQAELRRAAADLPIVDCALPRPSAHAALRGVVGYILKPIVPDMVQAFIKRVDGSRELVVLLVDDEPDAVRLLERMLTALPRPYRILKAYNGLQALAVMREQLPDIVFLDLVMPEMEGHEVLATMQADPRLAAVPVVVISGQDWIEQSVVLGQTFRLSWQAPVDLDRGVHCLQALLDGLAAAESARPLATAPRDQTAFATPPPPPAPAPDAAG